MCARSNELLIPKGTCPAGGTGGKTNEDDADRAARAGPDLGHSGEDGGSKLWSWWPFARVAGFVESVPPSVLQSLGTRRLIGSIWLIGRGNGSRGLVTTSRVRTTKKG
jgi:hypothetical protein